MRQSALKRAPARPAPPRSRGSHRRATRRLPRFRIAAGILFSMAALVVWATVARRVAPLANTSATQFDAILVLGTPADSDGNPTPEMLDRVTEGVREYQRGVARRIIVTGGAAHNGFVEAEVMAHAAEAQGVPPSAVFQETRALDTMQNACYSEEILKAHGWRSAEVISSAAHLPRAAMIFARLAPLHGSGLQWRMHASPDDLTPGAVHEAAPLVEVLKTVRYLVWARWVERCHR